MPTQSNYELRLLAASRGEKTFHGSPCKKGHGTLRYVSIGQCVQCAKDRAMANYATIREALKNAKQPQEV